MRKVTLYMNHWLDLHPYTAVGPSDGFYVDLANKLLGAMTLSELSTDVCCRTALYLAAYLEDQVSGLRLWQTFLKEHKRLYGSLLPFYELTSDYYADEVNREDVAFLLWNAWQKEVQHDEKAEAAKNAHAGVHANVHANAQLNVHAGASAVHAGFVNPLHPTLLAQADALYAILSDAYEVAPENEVLNEYFASVKDEADAMHKLNWLFGRTYLMEPSVMPYLANMGPEDLFIIPTGPLALFLSEWIDALGGDASWKGVKGLYVAEPEVPAEFVENNKLTYANFTEFTQGKNIVFLDGYDQLKGFLVNALHWPDDENHTLPQFRDSRDFILMVHEGKGMLLAKDICRYLAAPDNALYDPTEAAQGAFRLLTQEMLCPPDLLYRSIEEGWLPDLQVPGDLSTRDLVVRNADFIARHALLYYYRGD